MDRHGVSSQSPPTHVANTKTRRDHELRPTHPTEETADNADKRRWSHARLEHVARSRPSSDDGRGPLDQAIDNEWMNGATSSKQGKGEAKPTRPGRVGRWEEGLRRTLAFGADILPTGRRRSSDRRLFRRQSSALQHQGNYLRLSALSAVFLRVCAAFVSSCLRCLPLCFSLRSLCLCD